MEKTQSEALDPVEQKAEQQTQDFRRLLDRTDLDAVIVATPDHWHAIPTVMACQSGKDVYVEKPLALTIHEGRVMVDAARKYDRVVQMGTQQRSAPHFSDAVEYVKSGKLGKIRLVRSWAYLDWKGENAAPTRRSAARRGGLRPVARTCGGKTLQTRIVFTLPFAGTGTTPAVS